MEDLNLNKEIDLLKYPNKKCTACNCEIFNQGVVLKEVPGIEIGAGAETQIIPMEVFYCAKCGEMLDADKTLFLNKDITL